MLADGFIRRRLESIETYFIFSSELTVIVILQTTKEKLKTFKIETWS